MTSTGNEATVSVSIARQDTTVSVDMTCGTAGLADALEGEQRGMVSRGALQIDLTRDAPVIEGKVLR